MVKQTIYIDNYSTDGNSDIVTNTATQLELTLTECLMIYLRYAMLSLKTTRVRK